LTELELKKLLEARYTQREIAALFNCSPKTIANYQKLWGLKKKNSKQLIPPKTLKHLFLEQGLSDSDIAKLFGLSPHTVEKLRKDYNIKIGRRRTSEAQRRLTLALFKFLYLEMGATLNQISEITGLGVATVKRLRQEYNIKQQRAKGIPQEMVTEMKIWWGQSLKGVETCDKTKEKPNTGYPVNPDHPESVFDRMSGKETGTLSNSGETPPYRLPATNSEPN
jgi:DNA-binding CsgD family transcriptional regulator